jgi:RNA polymerase primary sigma factor
MIAIAPRAKAPKQPSKTGMPRKSAAGGSRATAKVLEKPSVSAKKGGQTKGSPKATSLSSAKTAVHGRKRSPQLAAATSRGLKKSGPTGVLAALREAFFDRQIDYIPCREFLKKDAEKLASTPPADAVVPLEQAGEKSVTDGPIAPYIARLYDARLLTKDEEQFYFRRMNWLKFRAAAARGKLDARRATRRQMQKIEALIEEADTVKQLIITANLRLVVSIAKKFVSSELLFEDLVSEGNLALMRSVEKFNFALGNRFSTYATYAIQRHFYRLSQRSRKQWNRFVSDDNALHALAASERDTEMCTSSQIDVLKQTFGRFLEELEPREKQIVVARFGFDGEAPRTFRELGSQMGVCKERIRQIQGRAMDKLRLMAEEASLAQTVGDWL